MIVPSFIQAVADRLPQSDKSLVRFKDSGEVAVYRADIMGWSVTGYDRAWGNPVELVTRFGDFDVIHEDRDE